MKMKYYVANNPYYALIKAEDKEEAAELYQNNVADYDEECDLSEVSSEFAIATYARSTDESGQLLDFHELLTDIQDDEAKLLLVDASLI